MKLVLFLRPLTADTEIVYFASLQQQTASRSTTRPHPPALHPCTTQRYTHVADRACDQSEGLKRRRHHGQFRGANCIGGCWRRAPLLFQGPGHRVPGPRCLPPYIQPDGAGRNHRCNAGFSWLPPTKNSGLVEQRLLLAMFILLHAFEKEWFDVV